MSKTATPAERAAFLAANIGGAPAYPMVGDPSVRYECGMTYRQWLIGRALQGAMTEYVTTSHADWFSEMASNAIEAADAVIAQLAEDRS